MKKIILCLILLIPYLYKLAMPIEQLIGYTFMSDDIFYYYKTAINIQTGYGPSFDTINLTTGFHPLWMAICVLLTFITINPITYLYIVLSVNMLFIFAFLYEIYQGFKNMFNGPFIYLTLCLMSFNYMSNTVIFDGLETPLFLFLLFRLLNYIDNNNTITLNGLIYCASLCGLIFLARTDFILIFVPILLYILNKYKLGYGKLFAIGTLAVLIFVVPYLYFNYVTCGHIVQISGLVKSTWDTGNSTWYGIVNNIKTFEFNTLSSIALRPIYLNPIIVPLLLMFMASIRQYRSKINTKLIVLMVISVILYVYYFFYDGKNLRVWHLSTICIWLQLMFMLALNVIYSNTRYPKIVTILITLIFVAQTVQIPYCHYRIINKDYYGNTTIQMDKAMKWVRDNVKNDETVGTWNAGYVGYFSGKKVINLDGLINGKELYDYYNKSNVYQYIKDKKINYICDYYYGDYDIVKYVESVSSLKVDKVFNTGFMKCLSYGKETYSNWYVLKCEY